MPFSITIHPHNQIIFISIYRNSQIQIPTLKIRIKMKIFFLKRRIHPSKKPIFRHPNRKIILTFILMLKTKSLYKLITINKTFFYIFIPIILTISLKCLHIRIIPRTHINHPINMTTPKLCQTL